MPFGADQSTQPMHDISVIQSDAARALLKSTHSFLTADLRFLSTFFPIFKTEHTKHTSVQQSRASSKQPYGTVENCKSWSNMRACMHPVCLAPCTEISRRAEPPAQGPCFTRMHACDSEYPVHSMISSTVATVSAQSSTCQRHRLLSMCVARGMLL